MPKPASSIKDLLEVKEGEKSPVRIHYPAVTITQTGTSQTIKDTDPAPRLSISSSIIKAKDAKYIALCHDIDAPFPCFPFLSPGLHSMQADLIASGDPNSDGFIELEPKAKPLASYLGPAPFRISARHRYLFMIWEQPENMTNETIRTTLGFAEQVGIPARARWDQEGFEKKIGLGKCLGGNYFYVG